MDSSGKVLLIVEDDPALGERLASAMEKRGFSPILADSVAAAKSLAEIQLPPFALIDLRLGDGNGLDVVRAVRHFRADAKIVVLTGYGNIATAVAAIKVGAVDFLAKPADADAIAAALLNADVHLPPPPAQPMSADRVRWEHILRVYHQCQGNISETARKLNMHRRTLQRILQKNAPRESSRKTGSD